VRLADSPTSGWFLPRQNALTPDCPLPSLQKYRLYMKRLQTSSQGRPEEGKDGMAEMESDGEEREEAGGAAAVDDDTA
jgi:hypothetical protein